MSWQGNIETRPSGPRRYEQPSRRASHPPSGQYERVRILEALEALRAFAALRQVKLDSIEPAAALGLFVDFYVDVRAEDADDELGGAADFIFVSWGTWDWNDGLFRYGLSRHFFLAGTPDEDADDGIWALDVDFYYPPTPETAAFGHGAEQCEDPHEAEQFRSVAADLPVTRWVQHAPAARLDVALRRDG